MFDTKLFEKYPYAFAHNAWTGELCLDDSNKPWSENESLPKGWNKLFWQCMEDIRKPLEKAGLTQKFYFLEVKEKYGSMRLYNNGATKEILTIIDQYEYLSQFICQKCGKPAEFQTDGWITNLCKQCTYDSKISNSVQPIKLDLNYTVTTYSPVKCNNGKFEHKTEKTTYNLSEKWNRLFNK